MKSSFVVLAALAPLVGATCAAAAPGQSIGSAVTVVNVVTAELERDTRTLQTGDKVHQDENIDVADDARGELKLDDDTQLALGPGSRMKLDKFVYDPQQSGGSIILNLVKGTFRFITGVAAKPTYVIRTPAASITVRGTIFDLFIHADGETWVLLHDGGLRACNARGRCQDLDERGKLIRITDNGDVDPPVKWAGLQDKDKAPFDSAFPFVTTAPSFDSTLVLSREVIILGNLPERETPKEEPKYEPEEPKQPKKAEKKYEKKEKKYREREEREPKRTRTAKKREDSGGVSGMDVVIGIGLGMGRRGGGGYKGGGGGMKQGGGGMKHGGGGYGGGGYGGK